MAPPERTLFIVNPRSAGGRTAKEWPAIEKIAREVMGTVSSRTTKAQGHATELAREGLSGGYDLIVSVGGDGTNNEVINGMFNPDGSPINSSVSFGILPRGTGCDLARTVKTPDDTRAALQALTNPPADIDIGKVDLTGHDGNPITRFFINVSGFGASGDVVARVNRSGKKLGGFATFYIATIGSLLSYKGKMVAYAFDDEEETTARLNTMFVCNAQFAGGGMNLAPEARMDDGLFDCTIVSDMGTIKAIANSRYLYNGKIYDHPDISGHKARKLRARPLETDPVLIDLDGEQPGRLPATFQVLPRALSIRC